MKQPEAAIFRVVQEIKFVMFCVRLAVNMDKNITLIYSNIYLPMSFASLSDNLEGDSVVSALPSSSVSITASVDC